MGKLPKRPFVEYQDSYDDGKAKNNKVSPIKGEETQNKRLKAKRDPFVQPFHASRFLLIDERYAARPKYWNGKP